MVFNRPTKPLLAEVLKKELLIRQAAHPAIDCDVVFRYGGFVGSVIDCHSSLPRAMEHARNHIREVESANGSVMNGMIILADTMSQSKGRFTRSWHAPSGGVWGCMVHANTLLDHSKRFVPLAVGVACCEAVRESGGSDATLRWVNDVLFGEKKVAGFLVEGFSGPHYGEEYHLVGFGINVNNLEFPPELLGIATSLSKELGAELDITTFTTLFLAKLAWNFGLLYYEESRELKGDGYSGKDGKHLLLENWLSLSDTLGQRVLFGFDVMTNPEFEATVIGLQDDGGLRLRFADGTEKVEHSGEIRYL